MFTQRYAASTREKSVGATALNLPRRTLFSSSSRRRCGSRASLIISEFHACAYIALLIFCERSSLSLSSFRVAGGGGVGGGKGISTRCTRVFEERIAIGEKFFMIRSIGMQTGSIYVTIAYFHRV